MVYCVDVCVEERLSVWFVREVLYVFVVGFMLVCLCVWMLLLLWYMVVCLDVSWWLSILEFGFLMCCNGMCGCMEIVISIVMVMNFVCVLCIGMMCCWNLYLVFCLCYGFFCRFFVVVVLSGFLLFLSLCVG